MRWVLRRRRKVRRVRRASAKSRAEFQLLKDQARMIVTQRLEHFNRHYGYAYNKIFIRNTRSRWGSCSSKHNLGFNYRVAKLSPQLVDYIVVHELCHIKEFNHSPAFWALVEQTIPNWKHMRKYLKSTPL
jgi:predicted metal-dependent hydrolase